MLKIAILMRCLRTYILLLGFTLPTNAAPKAETNTSMMQDWSELSPSSELQWVPCFENFTCTLLEVPLDYTNRSAGNTSIAFIKHSAKVQPALDLLMNPGGPGTSGITVLRQAIQAFEDTYGTAHNLVSFDPRGVNVSGPSLSCFPNDAGIVSISDALGSGTSQAPQSNATAYYQAQAFAQRCNLMIGGENGTAKYANTPSVATDMLTFIEAEARLNSQDPSEAKLRYMGFSYGTVLGQTFAAMYPDRVDRMILDGVEDGEDYYQGTWTNNIIHADEAVDSFFEYCYLAGPGQCEFYENTTEAIADRLQRLFNQLADYPIPVGDPAISPIPTLATLAGLRSQIFGMMYSPVTDYPAKGNPGFAALPGLFTDLENGNGTTLVAASPLAAGEAYKTLYNPTQAGLQVLCMDSYARRINLTTLADYVGYVAELQRESRWLGPVWTSQRTGCVGLDIVPPESSQFKGPLPPSASDINFPILFANNNVDPVTPLENAYKISKGFPGSAVVVQNATGHTTLVAPSKCLAGVFQAYLEDGKMPVSGTVCQPDLLPFDLKP